MYSFLWIVIAIIVGYFAVLFGIVALLKAADRVGEHDHRHALK